LKRLRITTGLVFLLAVLTRVVGLGVAPTPAGDEGNWALLGLQLSRGRPGQLPPDAAFVTSLFAHFISWMFRVFGPSWTSARLSLVFATLVTMVAVVRLAPRHAGTRMIALLALHPWAVLWGRTVSVPYSLALCTGVVGPLAWLHAVRVQSIWRLFFASQVLGLGLHFSPLAMLPFATCLFWSLRVEPLRRSHWPAALSGLLHLVPIAHGVVKAFHHGRQLSPALTAPWDTRFSTLSGTLLGDIAGTATLTHFASIPPLIAMVSVILAIVAIAAAVSQRTREGRFVATFFFISLIGLPCMLIPGRAWDMPVIDADRYGFALLAPMCLAVGSVTSWRKHIVRVYIASCAVLTSLAAVHFASGGCQDQGLYAARHGGCYRAWQTTSEGVALPDALRDEVMAKAAGREAVIEYNDYGFHVLRFSLASTSRAHNISHQFYVHTVSPNTLHFRVVWHSTVFAQTYSPAAVVRNHQQMRAAMLANPCWKTISLHTMPNGSPLCELWQFETSTDSHHTCDAP
jgi:hypothetical protein